MIIHELNQKELTHNEKLRNVVDTVKMDTHTFSSEEHYRASNAINYSLLSRVYDKGYTGWYEHKVQPEVPMTEGMRFGAIVDFLVTEDFPVNRDYREKFAIVDNKLSDNVKNILKQIADLTMVDNLDEVTNEQIVQVSAANDYYLTMPKRAIDEIRKQKDAYKETFANRGKIMITQSEFDMAMKAAHTLRTSENVYHYLFPMEHNADHKIYIYQKMWQRYIEKDNNPYIPIKCKTDVVIIDTIQKTIQPVDLKTSYLPEWEFVQAVHKWHYWIQAEVYQWVLEQLTEIDTFKDYTVKPMIFVVINKETLTPLTFVWDGTLHNYTLSKSWFDIAKTIWGYECKDNGLPNNIKRDEPNEICQFLRFEPQLEPITIW